MEPRRYPSRTVRRMFGDISPMTLWRWQQKGLLPEPRKINGRSYWDADAVDALASGAPASPEQAAA